MSLIKSTNTKPETAFRKLLSSVVYSRGYRYRLHYKRLPGKPDVVFVSRKIAIFVDGSFWHGYKLKKRAHKLSKEYWLPKIERNVMRDKKINRQLRSKGWKVLRIWEHELKKNPEKALDKVKLALKYETHRAARRDR